MGWDALPWIQSKRKRGEEMRKLILVAATLGTLALVADSAQARPWLMRGGWTSYYGAPAYSTWTYNTPVYTSYATPVYSYNVATPVYTDNSYSSAVEPSSYSTSYYYSPGTTYSTYSYPAYSYTSYYAPGYYSPGFSVNRYGLGWRGGWFPFR
jgi:hypothetical protein